ncbi:MAG: class I SAM-dependent methyltransferase [Candidatus Omnitrophica bacterium]|nr:class I SAM-dependent methyltransferase [Candidatus Omnitrophota bacterium]
MTKVRDFDKDAQSWDDSPLRTNLAKEVAAAIMRQVGLKEGMDVLDFGCGTGLLSFNIRPLVRSVTGVDTSKGMLDVFLAKARQHGGGNMKAYLLDLTLNERLSGSYHLVMSSMTLHHVKDTRMLVEQFYKVLEDGGHLALADLDVEDGRFHDSHDGVFHLGFDRVQLVRLLEVVGFREVSCSKATQICKADAEGQERVFSVFLITGRK